MSEIVTFPGAPVTPSKVKIPLLGDDVDISGLRTWYKGLAGVDLEAATTEIMIDMTMEGAGTITVTIVDQDRQLLRSGKLSSRQDVQIDGMWFRLASVNKSGKTLTLVFEDREVGVLRLYTTPIKQTGATSRTRVTRAQFILRMIKEPTAGGATSALLDKEEIPYFIPALKIVQPEDTATPGMTTADTVVNKGPGIPVKNTLTVKGSPMNESQRINANMILQVGDSKGMSRKILVVSIMVAIQESSITNLGPPDIGDSNYLGPDPDGNPVGVFQQIKKWGWPASRDVGVDAAAFFDKASQYEVSSLQYFEIGEAVQHSGRGGLYAKWRVEADRIVLDYGHPETTTQDANSQYNDKNNTGDYEFYRGLPPTTTTRKQKYGNNWGPESSWDCIQRLAQEVNWRAFFAIGAGGRNTFYYIDEDSLFKSQPIATLDEDSDGVQEIDGNYDEGKKTAIATLTVRMGRWSAPPGSIIQLVNMGPWNGRWLVNDVSRSAYNSQGTITLKKPMPKLPEPSAGNIVDTTGSQTWTGDPAPITQIPVATALVQPVPFGLNTKIVQGIHETLGLAGYPAADFGGDAGAPVVAVENGRLVRYSGSDPSLGPPMGLGGPLGWSIYLLGDSGSEYYYTHLASRVFQNPDTGFETRVEAGTVIATIADYAKYGGINHVHVGVNPASSGHPDITDLMNAPVIG